MSVKGQQDLVDLIDWSSVEVLNQNVSKSWVNALKKVGFEGDGSVDGCVCVRDKSS